MKALQWILGVMLAAGTLGSAAQQTSVIRVLDAVTDAPLVGAHILAADNTVLNTTNYKGESILTLHKESVTVRITHIAYQDTTFTVPVNTTIQIIRMIPRVNRLRAVSVTGAPINLIPDKPWFVSDYLHCDAGLLLLAYPKKMLHRQSLFLLDNQQEVIASLPWEEQGTLFMDASGQVWFRGVEYTTALFPENGKITPERPGIPSKDFDEGLARIDLAAGDRYFFRNYRYDNQLTEYYCYDHSTGTSRQFHTVANELGLKLRETRDIFETNEFERRFGEMCFFAPVYAPMFNKKNTLLVFNFADGLIEHFDSSLNIVRSVRIFFPKEKNIRKIILEDVVTDRFYTVYDNRGFCSLREVNPDLGTEGPEMLVPYFPFIEQLTVHDGMLYFLYKENADYHFKKIYRMPLIATAGTISVN